MKRIFGSIVVIVMFLVLATRGRALDLGDAAPPLQIGEWMKGSRVDLAQGKGKNIYVVEFWATWCPPCLESIPHLTALQKKFKDKGVIFVGISDEDNETVKPFVEKMGAQMEYAVALDKDQKTSAAYMGGFGVSGIPHAFVVDTNGVVAWRGHPMAGMEGVLEEIIAGKFDIEAAKRTLRAEKLIEEYFFLAATRPDETKQKKLGEQILADAGKNASMMNLFAWTILTNEEFKQRDLDLALRAAKAAYDTTGGKDANILDTYARALFDTGKIADAIATQKQAIKLNTNPNMRNELIDSLERYQNHGGQKK